MGIKPWRHRMVVWSLWIAAALIASALTFGVIGDYATVTYPDFVSDCISQIYESFSATGIYDESSSDAASQGDSTGISSSDSGSAVAGDDGATSGQDTTSDVKLNLIPLFLHNLFIAFLAVATGFIPFLFIPVLFIVFNGSLLGFIGGVTAAYGSLSGFMVDVLPHGIIELSAFVIAAAMGCILVMDVIRSQVTRQSAYDRQVLRDDIHKTVTRFLVIVLPMILIAAIIETYVTPLVAVSVL